jgi:hypothetical protein
MIIRVVVLILLLFATSASAMEYTLHWQINSGKNPLANDKEDGFYVMRRIGPGMSGWTIYGIAGPGVKDYTVVLPDDHTRHCFTIVGFNIIGEAPASNTLCKRGGQ